MERLTHRAMTTLTAILKDQAGLWLLSPHANDATEQATITWADDAPRMIRVDRMFLAGAKPHASGEEYLWIVDYKTTTHGGNDLDAFLEEQRQRYASQLEAYAKELSGGKPVRMALYFPALPRLIWWE